MSTVQLRWRRTTISSVLPLCTLALVQASGCRNATAPSAAPLALVLPAAIEGRYVSCPTCEIGLSVVAEFPVTISDPQGSGGTLQSVATTAVDTSRGTVLAQNTRPNADYPYTDTSLPAHGTLGVEAGVVVAPAPPPRDAVSVTVVVTLADRRTATASAPMVVVGQ